MTGAKQHAKMAVVSALDAAFGMGQKFRPFRPTSAFCILGVAIRRQTSNLGIAFVLPHTNLSFLILQDVVPKQLHNDAADGAEAGTMKA